MTIGGRALRLDRKSRVRLVAGDPDAGQCVSAALPTLRVRIGLLSSRRGVQMHDLVTPAAFLVPDGSLTHRV